MIEHKEIKFKDIIRAVSVKSNAWPYPFESQIKWIMDNMRPYDLHVFLSDAEKDIAYMTISHVVGSLNGLQTTFCGVGCVCAAKPGTGCGRLLMNNVNEFIRNNGQIGLLFCKTHILGFYEKVGWSLVPKERIKSLSAPEDFCTMVFNCPHVDSLDYQDRLF